MTALGLNPIFRGESPLTKSLSYGTVLKLLRSVVNYAILTVDLLLEFFDLDEESFHEASLFEVLN